MRSHSCCGEAGCGITSDSQQCCYMSHNVSLSTLVCLSTLCLCLMLIQCVHVFPFVCVYSATDSAPAAEEAKPAAEAPAAEAPAAEPAAEEAKPAEETAPAAEAPAVETPAAEEAAPAAEAPATEPAGTFSTEVMEGSVEGMDAWCKTCLHACVDALDDCEERW